MLRYVRISCLVLVVSLICFSFCCFLLPVLLVSLNFVTAPKWRFGSCYYYYRVAWGGGVACGKAEDVQLSKGIAHSYSKLSERITSCLWRDNKQ